MDSATSGSLQSSSGGGGGGGGGGDDELDSRPDALSAFFHGPALSHPFDSLSHYLSPPSPLLPFSASSAPAPAPPTNPNPSRHFLSSSSSAASSHGPAAPASAAAASGASAPAGYGQQRSSRKRTRASRRAPTTVLTTDTTNFRAMVQEFTGIPSPPFAAAAAAAATTLQYRSSARFGGHLFSGAGASSSSSAAVADPTAQPQQPPYLLRPFAQKLQPFPPLPSPSNTHSPTAAAATTATTASTAINTSPITATLTTCSSSGGSSNLTTPTNTNYQLPPPQHSLLNTQHPILSFQSLLQSQPPSNYAMPNMLTFSTRPPHFTVSSTSQYGSGDVGLPPGLIGSEGLSGWAGGNAASQSRPAGPNYAAGSAPQQRGSSCKVNYSSAAGSSSAPDQFNAEKGPSAPENAAAAGAAATTTTTTTIGEGTVDSWICSSRRDH